MGCVHCACILDKAGTLLKLGFSDEIVKVRDFGEFQLYRAN